MKKIALACLFALLAPAAHAAPYDLIINQRNSIDNGNVLRTITSPLTDGLFYYNATTLLPGYVTLGAGLSINSGVLSASAQGTQISSDWNATSGVQQILNKPAIKMVALTGQAGDLAGLAPVALTGAYSDLTGKPTLFSGSYTDLTNKPTIPAAYTFDFGQPVQRTLAASTAYQALSPAKAAIVTASLSCTNTTTVLASSACTIQVRQSASTGLTCSTGTTSMTWTSTVQLGLALTQTSGTPITIHVPVGGYFALCPTAGTFTVAATEQSAG